MIIKEETKEKIRKDFSAFQDKQYGNKTKEERQKMGQFFTPANLVIRMLEKFSDTEGTILDPCGGSGNLLVAAIYAGFDPKKVYYNELDPEIFEIGKDRLLELGVPPQNMHIGNALEESAYVF